MKALVAAMLAATLLPACQEEDDFDKEAIPIGSSGARMRFQSIETQDAKWKPDGTPMAKPKRDIFDLPNIVGVRDGHRLWVQMRVKPEDEGDYDFRFVEVGKAMPQ